MREVFFRFHRRTANRKEISLTIYLDCKTRLTVRIDLYWWDGSHCLDAGSGSLRLYG